MRSRGLGGTGASAPCTDVPAAAHRRSRRPLGQQGQPVQTPARLPAVAHAAVTGGDGQLQLDAYCARLVAAASTVSLDGGRLPSFASSRLCRCGARATPDASPAIAGARAPRRCRRSTAGVPCAGARPRMARPGVARPAASAGLAGRARSARRGSAPSARRKRDAAPRLPCRPAVVGARADSPEPAQLAGGGLLGMAAVAIAEARCCHEAVLAGQRQRRAPTGASSQASREMGAASGRRGRGAMGRLPIGTAGSTAAAGRMGGVEVPAAALRSGASQRRISQRGDGGAGAATPPAAGGLGGQQALGH